MSNDYINVSNSSKTSYPSPFFDLSRLYMPKNVKTLFKYCRIFFYKNAFLNSIITKLTEYPITDILIETDKEEIKEKYKNILNHYVKLKQLLISIGLDYFTFGNAFISVNMQFKRFLVCDSCNTANHFDSVKYKWKNFSFSGECPSCKAHTTFTIQDSYLKHPKFFSVIRWSPENIDIEYNPITGTTRYYYLMPKDLKSNIIKGKRNILAEIPEVFLIALKENKKIELDKSNLYHFKRPTLAEEDQGWGKPLILPAMAEIWYMQTLKKSNEAIAAEHIVPMRILYPQQQSGSLDPFSQLNLKSWAAKLQSSIDSWRRDPNHSIISPIPVGMENYGGDAKILTVTEELKIVEETIITSLGVPREFIKGGASWSGSSISLRIIENHFLNYRALLEDFLNFFLIPKLRQNLNLPEVKLRFKKLRMADDSEAKRIGLEMVQLESLSKTRLLEDLGYDPEVENELIKQEKEAALDIQANSLLKQVEIEALGAEKRARTEVKVLYAKLDERAKLRENKFEEILKQELKQIDGDGDISETLARYADEILLMGPDERMMVLQHMSQKMPYTAKLVLQRVKDLMTVGLGESTPINFNGDSAEQPQEEGEATPKRATDVDREKVKQRKDSGEKQKPGVES